MLFQSINPSNDELIRSYAQTPWGEAVQKTEKTNIAFLAWAHVHYHERAVLFYRMARIIKTKKEELARLMAKEMGKPLSQGIAEAEKCAWVCEYYADQAEKFLKPEIIPTDAGKSYTAFTPLGVILAIMPWNFPFWQVIRFLAPALMAGNAALLKHAPNVTGCAFAIRQLVIDAGFPEEIFNVLLLGNDEVAKLIEHPLIKGVTLTGSVRAGSAVAALAGRALKKTVMELGGSDPYVILEDADIELAAETCVQSRLINSGQSCIAAKRFLVTEPVRKPFEELFIEKMKTKTMGDPLAGNFDIGPLARKDLRETLHHQVERSIQQGALLKLGGKIPDGKGAFYPPTVLTNVKKNMMVFEEETFGPVAAIVPAANEMEAIRLANATSFGLGGAVFTRDVARGEKIAREQVEAGACFVNALVKSDPRLPFGGIKQSGYGRELSVFGIREFVNIKTVYVK